MSKEKIFVYKFKAIDGLNPSFRRVYVYITNTKGVIIVNLKVNEDIKICSNVNKTNLDKHIKLISRHLYKHQVDPIKEHLTIIINN